MRSLLMLVLGCSLLAGCGHDSNPNAPSPSPVNESVTLAPGQSVTINSALSLRFRGVVSDSRCPAAAICITGGEAVLAFDVMVGGGAEVKYELKSEGAGKTLTLSDYVIALELVAPYPINDPIPPGDYRATVRVTSR
jgi:hypothetical protein